MDNGDRTGDYSDECNDYGAGGEYAVSVPIDGDECWRFRGNDGECYDKGRGTDGTGELDEYRTDGEFRHPFVGSAK